MFILFRLAGLQMVWEKCTQDDLEQVPLAGPTVLLHTLQNDLKMSPQTGSSYRGWLWSITMQKLIMRLVDTITILLCQKGSSDSYAPGSKAQHWAPQV